MVLVLVLVPGGGEVEIGIPYLPIHDAPAHKLNTQAHT